MKRKKYLIIASIIIFFVILIGKQNSINAAGKYDYMIVGDSRTMGIYDAYTGNYTMDSVNKSIQINGKNVKILAVSGIGYDYWFGNNSHYAQITNALSELKTGGSCFIWLGINGNISDSYSTKYANSLEDLARGYTNKNIYFCSVTGIYKQTYDMYYNYSINNNDITNFNNKVKSLINSKSRSNLIFKDIANTNVKIGSETKTVNNWVINSNKYATDGLHYLGENRILYKAIWEQAMTSDSASSGGNTGGTSSGSGSRTSSGTKSSLVVGQAGKNETRAEVSFTDVFNDKDYYSDFDDIDENSKDRVEKSAGKVVAVLTNIGMVLSIIMPTIIGIKYMISNRIEAKKDIIPYLVGSVILFSVCIITKILQIIGKGINSI